MRITDSVDMHVEERTFLKRLDINYALVIFALNVIGLINLYSATHGASVNHYMALFSKQLVWLLAGWSLFFLSTVLDYKFFKRTSYIFYFMNIVFLIAVMFYGKKYYGAQRWLDLGSFKYQPSETMKLAIVLVLAKVLAKTPSNNGLGFKALGLPLILTGIPVAITIKQPDLGTGLLILAISLSMILFIGVTRRVILIAITTVIVTLPIVWNYGLKPYQKDRILTFLDPGRDPRDKGYNSIQSKIAVGSGQIVGKGFRKGTQSQLEFLPERHTDFIYSVLSEEHGFIGSVATFGLFLTLYWMAIRIASQARDKFGVLIVVGVTSYLFWHVTINIGMVIGLLPIVGVPLPLLSYGGSSMMSTMVGLGLISSVAFRKYLF